MKLILKFQQEFLQDKPIKKLIITEKITKTSYRNNNYNSKKQISTLLQTSMNSKKSSCNSNNKISEIN